MFELHLHVTLTPKDLQMGSSCLGDQRNWAVLSISPCLLQSPCEGQFLRWITLGNHLYPSFTLLTLVDSSLLVLILVCSLGFLKMILAALGSPCWLRFPLYLCYVSLQLFITGSEAYTAYVGKIHWESETVGAFLSLPNTSDRFSLCVNKPNKNMIWISHFTFKDLLTGNAVA